VITLAKSNKGSDDVISRGVAVVERLVSKPVSQAVDTERGLLDKAANSKLECGFGAPIGELKLTF
jgi:hypothetical protein